MFTLDPQQPATDQIVSQMLAAIDSGRLGDGARGLEQAQCLDTVGGHADDDAGTGGGDVTEQIAQARARRRLIIDDQHAQRARLLGRDVHGGETR